MRTVSLMKYMLVASVLALTILGCRKSDDSDIVSELTRMEQEFAAATLRGDTATVERLLADEFLGIDPDGRRLSKTDVLANLKSANTSIIDLRHEDIRIAVFGDCAVATARTVVKWTQGGEKMEGQFPYMRVWINRHGSWLAVATQSSSKAR